MFHDTITSNRKMFGGNQRLAAARIETMCHDKIPSAIIIPGS